MGKDIASSTRWSPGCVTLHICQEILLWTHTWRPGGQISDKQWHSKPVLKCVLLAAVGTGIVQENTCIRENWISHGFWVCSFNFFPYRNLFVTNETIKRMPLGGTEATKLRFSLHELILNPKTRADFSLDCVDSFWGAFSQCVKQTSHLLFLRPGDGRQTSVKIAE